MRLGYPVADEENLASIKSTPLQQGSEFLEIDPRQFGWKDADDMKNVVGIDQGGQELDP
jgi:hypothetical protein